MFTSSLHGTAAACSSPIVHYYNNPQQHHYQLQESPHFQSPNQVVQDAAAAFVQHPIGRTITPSLDKSKAMNMMPESAEAVPKKIKKKPDNRSKVRTAKGLRDRRVRMSIGIARKFFDLQDLLGFDKPSRTLEWLLTNSNKAILELSGEASSSSTSSVQAETAVVKRLGDSHTPFSMHTIKEAVKPSCSDDLKISMNQKAALLARQSRAKARARARARTVAKLSTANLNHQKNRLLYNPEYLILSSGDHQTYFGSMSMRKSVESESHKEERKTGGDHEQLKQNQEFQLQNNDSVIKFYHRWTGMNPNLSLDYWDNNYAYSQQGSSAAHQLNLSKGIHKDYNITGRASWDTLRSDYESL